jgi:hypothetical protein
LFEEKRKNVMAPLHRLEGTTRFNFGRTMMVALADDGVKFALGLYMPNHFLPDDGTPSMPSP